MGCIDIAAVPAKWNRYEFSVREIIQRLLSGMLLPDKVVPKDIMSTVPSSFAWSAKSGRYKERME